MTIQILEKKYIFQFYCFLQTSKRLYNKCNKVERYVNLSRIFGKHNET